MSYNGVGLETARGSGTNGYVQRNFALVKFKRDTNPYRPEDDQAKLDIALSRKPNEDILEHDRKRTVELKCIAMQDKMEAQG
jgi:serine/arginine repetitive matrix protein 2